jgi:molybdenum cofactor cytidylyltransferase
VPGAEAGRHALVLAAGAGSRFGGGKLVADWRGAPLVLAAVTTALAASVERITVVTGSDATAVSAAVDALEDPRLSIVYAERWADGLSASIRAGIDSLPHGAKAVVVFLADMPSVPAALADELLDAVLEGAPAAVVVSPHGPAHPAAFAASLFDALRKLDGDRGARGLLGALGPEVARISCDDPGVVFDVDRRSDL